MDLLQKIKENAKARRVKECTIFEQKVLCVLHSKKSLSDVRKKFAEAIQEDKSEAVLAKQFLDPETKKPFLTQRFLQEECAVADVEELLDLFLKLNNYSVSAVEEAEKN